MSRLSVFNMFVGFTALFFSACAGPFLAYDATSAFVHDPSLLHTWSMTLMTSAHGHTSLFGTLHVLMGLTFPYSRLPLRIKKWQTAGLGGGTLAMSLMMFMRALGNPVEGFDIPGVITGILLSGALVALAAHSVGLAAKFWR